MRRVRQLGMFQGYDLEGLEPIRDDEGGWITSDELELELLQRKYHPDTPRSTFDPLSDPLNDPFPEELE